jgi:sugar phosphate isomerase/epimerase
VKLAFSNLAAPDWSFERTLAAVHEYGYDGLELRLLDGEPIDATSVKLNMRRSVGKALKDAAVPLASFDTSVVLAEPFETELNAALELGHFWGAPVVRVFGGALDPTVSRGRALDDVARRLEPTLQRAEQLGVAVALETHDSFSSAALVAELIALVGNPWLVALWDLHHTYRVGESPQEVVDLLGDRIVQVHIKDARHGSGGQYELVLLGEGDVPVAESLAVLQAASWDGWISVEWEKRWYTDLPEPEIALPQHSSLLRWAVTNRATTTWRSRGTSRPSGS